MQRDPAGVRADPVAEGTGWDAGDCGDLLELGRAFRRVGPSALGDPRAFLHQVVAGLFGARADAAGGRFELAPWIPEGWRTMALRRLRCHRTLLSVEVRPRVEWVTVRLERSFGPAIPLVLGVRNVGPVQGTTVDEVALEGGRAIFTLQGLHEVVFFLGGERP